MGLTRGCHLRWFTGVVIVCSCLGCCRLRFDGSLADALEEKSWWYLSSSRANIREFVCLRVVCSGDVIELATIEASLQCVVELPVCRHVVCDCIAVSHRLLDDEVGVAVNCEASGAACFGHAHAVE